jgi:gluconate kinase
VRGDARPVPLPRDVPFGALDVAFPGRDESFVFRQELERTYRDVLRRTATATFVDIEGDLVWTQEYLRYRVNQCSHVEAVQRVLDQIDGRPAGAVCGAALGGVVAFPPRNEPFDFRQELERKYRDGLRRTASATFVDIEGSIVWTQEYLRYRVNGCGHVAASLKVFDQIAGRGIAPVCVGDLAGLWDGTSNYFNAPFVMDLAQSGTNISGTYRDQHDRGTVSGTVTGSLVALRVNFGDTGILVDGTWDRADVVNGDLTIGGGIGRRSFEMRRRH